MAVELSDNMNRSTSNQSRGECRKPIRETWAVRINQRLRNNIITASLRGLRQLLVNIKYWRDVSYAKDM